MKALVLFSGGIDSSTCLAMAIDSFGNNNVICLTISYGQKHKKELEAAQNIVKYYGVDNIIIDLSTIFIMSNCSLLSHSDHEIPNTSYMEQLNSSNGQPVSTYVPFRNGTFLSIAASIAISNDCDFIYYGAHMDDAAGNAYPDCSISFYKSIGSAIYEGSGQRLKVIAPFISLNKTQIVAHGITLGVPYNLTWSCYNGSKIPCGKCGTCLDRKKAFENNHLTDPLIEERI